MAHLDFDPYPVEIDIAVFDLLPPGKLSSIGWWAGCGLYHSAVRIKDQGTEYAFGGHDQPSISGVFGVPCGPNDPILPGLRFVKLIPLGTAFSGQWRRCAESTDSSDPAQASLLAHAQSMPRNSSSSNRSSDSYARQRRQETKEETLDRIMSVIDSFKRDQSWNGPAYDLLNKNCNHFTEVLAFALTGKHIPAWINRAAWIGLRLPCLVPDGWVEPPEDQLQAQEQSNASPNPQADSPAYDQQPTPSIPKLT